MRGALEHVLQRAGDVRAAVGRSVAAGARVHAERHVEDAALLRSDAVRVDNEFDVVAIAGTVPAAIFYTFVVLLAAFFCCGLCSCTASARRAAPSRRIKTDTHIPSRVYYTPVQQRPPQPTSRRHTMSMRVSSSWYTLLRAAGITADVGPPPTYAESLQTAQARDRHTYSDQTP